MPCRSWYKFTSSRIAIGAHILASGFLVATCPAKHSNKSMKEQKVITERKNVIREEWSISSTFVSSIIAPLRISSFPYLRPPICLCTLAWKVTDIMCSLHANPTGIFKNLIPSVRRGERSSTLDSIPAARGGYSKCSQIYKSIVIVEDYPESKLVKTLIFPDSARINGWKCLNCDFGNIMSRPCFLTEFCGGCYRTYGESFLTMAHFRKMALFLTLYSKEECYVKPVKPT